MAKWEALRTDRDLFDAYMVEHTRIARAFALREAAQLCRDYGAGHIALVLDAKALDTMTKEGE